MRSRTIILILAGLLLVNAIPCFAGEDLDDLLLSGIADRRVTRQGLLDLIDEALQAQKEKPSDYTTNWMCAALNYLYGDFYASAAEEKKTYFTRCKDFAEKAVRINPNGPAGHYWLGVGLAKWAEHNGVLYSLFTADDILNEMNIVIRINPAFFRGLPYVIRATVYAMAPGIISVGNWDLARADIKTAMIYGKGNRPVYLLIANIYIYWKEWENARQIIELALTFPFDQRLELEETDCIRKLNAAKKQVEAEIAKMKR